jgi:hypothetical protein
MIFDPYNPVFNTIFVYIIVMLLIISSKPKILYDTKRKKFKQFGTGKNETVFTLPIIAILVAVLLYIIFVFIERYNKSLDNNNKKNINNTLPLILEGDDNKLKKYVLIQQLINELIKD